jgi:hypothetical protein
MADRHFRRVHKRYQQAFAPNFRKKAQEISLITNIEILKIA